MLFGVTFSLALFFCGLLLYTEEKKEISYLKQEESTFNCIISDYPEEKEKSYRLTVRLVSTLTDSGVVPVGGSMFLYMRKDSSLKPMLPGDQITIRCKPTEIVNRGNPCEFDYRFYCLNRGIRYFAFTASEDLINHSSPEHRSLAHRALIIRERIIGMYRERGIKGRRLALVAAITLGQKNMLDQDQKEDFIKAGVMHIMAVSGLHAMLLSIFVFNMLGFLKGRFNWIRIVITLLILWSFAYITGLTPSVLRATLMFTFIQAGGLLKRHVNSINSVLASAFVLILRRPSVIFDAGFLLSYSAVIYIICFYSDIYRKVQLKNRFADQIWQMAAVTLVAQTGTLPLTITLFNRFPTYFLVTNIIIVPLSNLLIITGCLVPLLFPIRLVSTLLAKLLSFLAGLTEYLTAKASSMPMANLEGAGMTNSGCMIFSALLFMFLLYILKDKPFRSLWVGLILLLFVIAGTVREIRTRTTGEVVVYNIPGRMTVGIRTGRLLRLYSDTASISEEAARHCAVLRLKPEITVIKDQTVCIRTGKVTIAICSKPSGTQLEAVSPDIIVLAGLNREPLSASLPPGYKGDLVVCSGTTIGRTKIQGGVLAQPDTVHFTSFSGAYRKRLRQ